MHASISAIWKTGIDHEHIQKKTPTDSRWSCILENAGAVSSRRKGPNPTDRLTPPLLGRGELLEREDRAAGRDERPELRDGRLALERDPDDRFAEGLDRPRLGDPAWLSATDVAATIAPTRIGTNVRSFAVRLIANPRMLPIVSFATKYIGSI